MVRFIRTYDIHKDCMVNVWQNLTSEQAKETILGVEWVQVGESFEEVMAEIEKVNWIRPEEFQHIRAAYKNIREAKPPVYYTVVADA